MTAVFPFKPDYNDLVKDSFEWLTEVQQSYDGSEHRRQLRQYPRRFVEFKLTLSGQNKQLFENLLAAKQGEVLFLPLWHEKSTLLAQTGGGDSVLNLNTANRSFLIGGHAIVFTDSLNYEIVTITNKSADTLTISPAIVGSFAANTAVYPLVLARLEESVKPNRRSSNVLQSTLNFWLEENCPAFTAVDFSDTYRTAPLLDTRNNWSRQINSEYNRQLETIDFQVFGRFIDDQSNTPTVFLDYHFILKTLAERHAFMEHLYALAGKWSSVWVPTGQHDLALASPITSGNNFISVHYCGLSAYGLSAPRQDIKITLKNGDVYLRRILYVDVIGDVEILTLDSVIAANIAVSDVLIISYLMLMRLSADSVTIENHTGTIAECSVTFQSVDETYTYTPPPPTVNASFSPATVNIDETTTLSWSATNADYVQLSSHGATHYNPVGTLTYSYGTAGGKSEIVTAYGAGGSAADTANVTVIVPGLIGYVIDNTSAERNYLLMQPAAGTQVGDLLILVTGCTSISYAAIGEIVCGVFEQNPNYCLVASKVIATQAMIDNGITIFASGAYLTGVLLSFANVTTVNVSNAVGLGNSSGGSISISPTQPGYLLLVGGQNNYQGYDIWFSGYTDFLQYDGGNQSRRHLGFAGGLTAAGSYTIGITVEANNRANLSALAIQLT